MNYVVLILFMAACFVAYRYLFRGESARSARDAAPVTPPSSAHHWPGSGDFEVAAVGESFNRKAIQRLVGDHGDEHVEKTFVATLVPDDDNPHDNRAVAIYINRVKVGHMSRDDARSFRRRLGAKKLTGQFTSCDALVQYGGLVDGKRFDYSVSLDIKPFD